MSDNNIPYTSNYGNFFAYARFVKNLKFLAYSNEVGETIRHTFPKLVIPAYCLSFGYVFADLYHHIYPLYQKEGLSTHTQTEFKKRAVWHGLASMLFPTLAIGSGVKLTKLLMTGTNCSVRSIRWTLPIVGIGLIPLVIKPIDDFTEHRIMPKIEPYLSHNVAVNQVYQKF